MPPSVVSWLTTLSDVARLRMLRLLDREELSVGELARVVQLPQSTVSRHLKVLHEGSWVHKRSEGTASFYRLRAQSLPSGAAELWALTRRHLGATTANDDDDHRLAEVLAERVSDSRSFFGRVAGDWDGLRQSLFGTEFTLDALLGLLPGDLVVADLGCGTGNAAERIAPLVQRVIAVDREQAMLDAARLRLAAHPNVEFRSGDLLSLPLADGELDAAMIFLVLHHLDEPSLAIREAARTLRPGGRLLIVDMTSHDRESFRFQMGHRHLGFDEREVRQWADDAGLETSSFRRLRPDTSAKGPGLFAAVLANAAR